MSSTDWWWIWKNLDLQLLNLWLAKTEECFWSPGLQNYNGDWFFLASLAPPDVTPREWFDDAEAASQQTTPWQRAEIDYGSASSSREGNNNPCSCSRSKRTEEGARYPSIRITSIARSYCGRRSTSMDRQRKGEIRWGIVDLGWSSRSSYQTRGMEHMLFSKGGDGPSGAQMATGTHSKFGLVTRKPGDLMGVKGVRYCPVLAVYCIVCSCWHLGEG
jgi:hypothetical protein